jgi:hypothetical protein
MFSSQVKEHWGTPNYGTRQIGSSWVAPRGQSGKDQLEHMQVEYIWLVASSLLGSYVKVFGCRFTRIAVVLLRVHFCAASARPKKN